MHISIFVWAAYLYGKVMFGQYPVHVNHTIPNKTDGTPKGDGGIFVRIEVSLSLPPTIPKGIQI